MLDNREAMRNWLSEVVAQTGATATELARRAGIAPSTLTRFLSKADAPLLNSTTIAKIRYALAHQSIDDEPADGFVRYVTTQGPNNSGCERRGARSAANLLGEQIDLLPAHIRDAIKALIANKPDVAAWCLDSTSLEDVGYVPNDIVIVDKKLIPMQGDVVLAWDAFSRTNIFRLYDEPYLIAATRDSCVRKPLLVDGSIISIQGVVISSLRQRIR